MMKNGSKDYAQRCHLWVEGQGLRRDIETLGSFRKPLKNVKCSRAQENFYNFIIIESFLFPKDHVFEAVCII